MHIPFGDFKRQYIELQGEIDDAMRRVVQSGAYVLGPAVKAFEAEFAAYCEVPFSIGVGNGTDAIQLGLIAIGVRPGDEVITVANTGVPGVAAIVAVGAKPVFVDVDAQTRNMDATLLEQAITSRTKAILPVHLYGLMADMPAIMAIGQRHGIPIIEDVAQAQGARLGGARAGSIGAVAAFSFYPSKNLGAFGDGGALTTNDSGIDAELRKLRVYGWERKYYSTVESGINSRLDELQAAILSVKLRHLEASTARRVQIAAYYNTQLADTGLLLPYTPAGYAAVYHLYVVQTPHRDAYMATLKQLGVTTDIHYPMPTHRQPIYTRYAPSWGLPVTDIQAQQVFSLPNFPELSDVEVEYVATATRQATLSVKGK